MICCPFSVISESETELSEDLEKRKEVFHTLVKAFTVEKIEKEVEVTLYGIPFLPIVRNTVLGEQERSVSPLLIPEYSVTLHYRKRRFVLPKEYNNTKTLIVEVELQCNDNTQNIEETFVEGTPSK